MLNNMERSKDNNAAHDWLSPTFTLIDFRKLEFNDSVEMPVSPAEVVQKRYGLCSRFCTG